MLGVHTNLGRLGRILGHTRFAAGELDTAFLRDDDAAFQGADPAAPPDVVLAAVAAAAASGAAPLTEPLPPAATDDPWATLGAWRVSA